jgi:hypothetical protein
MKTKLLALLFLVGSSAFAGPHVFFGVGVGPAYGYYAAPPPAAAYVAPAPAPGYVPGYYNPVGPSYVYQPGYWGRPPYPHAVWIGPRYFGGRHYAGYWRR